MRFTPLGRLSQQRIDDGVAADQQPSRQHDQEQRQDHGHPRGLGAIFVVLSPAANGGPKAACRAGVNRRDDGSRLAAGRLGDAHTGIKQGIRSFADKKSGSI